MNLFGPFQTLERRRPRSHCAVLHHRSPMLWFRPGAARIQPLMCSRPASVLYHICLGSAANIGRNLTNLDRSLPESGQFGPQSGQVCGADFDHLRSTNMAMYDPNRPCNAKSDVGGAGSE